MGKSRASPKIKDSLIWLVIIISFLLFCTLCECQERETRTATSIYFPKTMSVGVLPLWLFNEARVKKDSVSYDLFLRGECKLYLTFRD